MLKRSTDQHRAEWFYYRLISGISGHTPYEIYEIMAKKFLLCIDEDGELAYIKPSSLDTIEHNDYMEQIRAEMIKYGIYLPEPSQVDQYELAKTITKKTH